MEYELNKNNNSKKLYIGVFILFCTVILIIGATTAFFTQSGVGDSGNIVTTNINGTIGYTDNNDYMRNNLIPVKEGDISLFATKNSVNQSGKYTNEDICLYQDDMYACSLYEFTITNNADVTQDMKVTLTPYPNGFTNLYYMVYESKQLELNADSKVAKTATHIDKENASTMIESVTLTPKESKTYTVVFYIKAMGYDQTGEDADKNFGAIIRVDSITTGEFESIIVGTSCYEYEEINEGEYAGTYKLTKFNGIDENGNANTFCGVTENNGFYSVIIPSNIGGKQISTIGNALFLGIDLTKGTLNNYSKITNVVISEGIKAIENGDLNSAKAAFGVVGVESIDLQSKEVLSAYDLKVTIPSTMKTIGNYAFGMSGIKEITFKKDEAGNNSLKTIGDYAFTGCSLIDIDIPSNVETIGDYAFYGNNFNTLTIPYSVTTIGDSAFYNNHNLTKLTFTGSLTDITEDNELTIGDSAFSSCSLDYSGEEELVLPARISSIGVNAFIRGGLELLYNIRYMGSRERLDSLGTNWFLGEPKAYGE